MNAKRAYYERYNWFLIDWEAIRGFHVCKKGEKMSKCRFSVDGTVPADPAYGHIGNYNFKCVDGIFGGANVLLEVTEAEDP